MRYDHIVIESGSAGGIIATRLSENPERSVLLLEAGPTIRTSSDYRIPSNTGMGLTRAIGIHCITGNTRPRRPASHSGCPALGAR